MRVGDLFSGIGGFSIAAHWMGWETAWFSEIDPFASRVLAHHWPDVPNHGDITRIDWTTVEPVDVLTGGFPCQPHSLAGKRLASSDERDLFSEIIRAVRVLRPRYVVLENVRGLLTSESGRFFGRVLGSLADCGYDAEWRVLSAADVGAPHLRERVWITADTGRTRGPRLEPAGSLEASGPWGLRGPEDLQRIADHPFDAGASWPQPLLRRMDDGLPHRVDRLHALGNSIVPACALEIFRSIEAREDVRRAA